MPVREAIFREHAKIAGTLAYEADTRAFPKKTSLVRFHEGVGTAEKSDGRALGNCADGRG